MPIDWVVVATLAAPVIALFAGIWVNRIGENRPILVFYYGHTSAFKYTTQTGNKVDIFTHTVVLTNIGRKSASDIRLGHSVLPDFVIYPSAHYSVEDLPDGSRDIVIPTLVPREQIVVSYLYFPPTTWKQINTSIKSKEGFARQVPVLLQQQYPLSFSVIAAILMFVGLVTLLYLLYEWLHRIKIV
ncbi:MAG: hypothetical protein IVW51_15870 [Thermaceae bacterium]|nr:hypothetical protein [Thermaceae bacterium]